jgi:polyisoprenoid-binding protein YceI
MTTTASATRTFQGADVPSAGTYVIDASHTDVGFAARHLMVSKVRGSFSGVKGEIVIAENPLESSVEVEIDLASVDTRDDKRDEHLRSADFFDVANHPTATFRSTAVRQGKGDRWILDGALSLAGVTRPVELELTYEGSAASPWGTTSVGFSATARVNREDFGLTWNQALETGGVLVGKDINLVIEAEAVQQ